MAGVIMLSPKKSAAPKTPRPASRNLMRPCTPAGIWRIREISAMIPPSPSLSAPITRPTYLKVTSIITAQKTSETKP